MPDRLYWNTVKPHLKDALTRLMQSKVFQKFRLVGGTSLSLQIGHRMSDDIDLFTDEEYDTIDFKEIDKFLRNSFQYVSDLRPGPIALGVSYLIGDSKDDGVKLDLYYTDHYIQAPLKLGPYRLATIEEIIAMKIDIVQRKARKKDFWDIPELLGTYTPAQMINLHAQRYPYSHDEELIRKNFTDFSKADGDFEPVCRRGKYWELVKLDIIRAIKI
ncbi:MAG: nucleotidyl transferase AbiEii/AbiGii toxin family protein [Bacteroidota bacterium]